jgi:7-keto-8-aminopelargonate synthetase-like enzyme
VGLAGVAEPWWGKLTVSASQLEASEQPADTSPLWLLMAREANVAAWVGLCTAVREFTALRPTNGQDVRAVRAALLGEHGIVTTAGAITRAPREMTEPLLRISPHVDVTPEDLARLRSALHALR